MTWDEIYERADDMPYGSDELRAKDHARWQTRNLVLDRTGYDIENAECPEDEVDHYVNLWDIKFNESGDIVSYKDDLTYDYLLGWFFVYYTKSGEVGIVKASSEEEAEAKVCRAYNSKEVWIADRTMSRSTIEPDVLKIAY